MAAVIYSGTKHCCLDRNAVGITLASNFNNAVINSTIDSRQLACAISSQESEVYD